MIRKFQKVLYVLPALFVLFSPGLAFAQAAPAEPAPGGTFDQRLVQRKTEQNVQLDKKSSDRLVGKCVAAQNSVRKIQQQATTISDDRQKTYQNIDGLLWITIGQLKLAGQDTFELEKERVQLAVMTKDFQTTSTDYLQALDDMTVINCQADPIGFKALLLTARFYHDQMRSQSKEIRNYVVNTIKPTIAKHVADLKTNPATEE